MKQYIVEFSKSTWGAEIKADCLKTARRYAQMIKKDGYKGRTYVRLKK